MEVRSKKGLIAWLAGVVLFFLLGFLTRPEANPLYPQSRRLYLDEEYSVCTPSYMMPSGSSFKALTSLPLCTCLWHSRHHNEKKQKWDYGVQCAKLNRLFLKKRTHTQVFSMISNELSSSFGQNPLGQREGVIDKLPFRTFAFRYVDEDGKSNIIQFRIVVSKKAIFLLHAAWYESSPRSRCAEHFFDSFRVLRESEQV